ncbi:hypothetical protein ABK040_015646 [Willaertia magna]
MTKYSYIVKVISGSKLISDKSDISDPYVIIESNNLNWAKKWDDNNGATKQFNGKTKSVQTTVKENTLNPEWNEYFETEVFPDDGIAEETFTFKVFDKDQFTKDDPLGEVKISFEKKDLKDNPYFMNFVLFLEGVESGRIEIAVKKNKIEESTIQQ